MPVPHKTLRITFLVRYISYNLIIKYIVYKLSSRADILSQNLGTLQYIVPWGEMF